jgi:hypothetical protein
MCWCLQANGVFNNFITILIVLNTITLGAEHTRVGCLRHFNSTVDEFSNTTLEAMGFEGG